MTGPRHSARFAEIVDAVDSELGAHGLRLVPEEIESMLAHLLDESYPNELQQGLALAAAPEDLKSRLAANLRATIAR